MANAIAHPSSRAVTGAGGVHTGSTYSSNVTRRPAAIVSLSTPASVTAAPRTKVSATANHGIGCTNVPIVISTAPLNPRPQYPSARTRRLPGKSTSPSSQIAPSKVNNAVCDSPATE